jgi:hypothetical protein
MHVPHTQAKKNPGKNESLLNQLPPKTNRLFKYEEKSNTNSTLQEEEYRSM